MLSATEAALADSTTTHAYSEWEVLAKFEHLCLWWLNVAQQPFSTWCYSQCGQTNWYCSNVMKSTFTCATPAETDSTLALCMARTSLTPFLILGHPPSQHWFGPTESSMAGGSPWPCDHTSHSYSIFLESVPSCWLSNVALQLLPGPSVHVQKSSTLTVADG